MVVNVEDKRVIKKVNLIYPELMSGDAEVYIRKDYQSLLDTQDELDKARQKVRELEEKLKADKAVFSSMIGTIFTIEFGEKAVERIENNAVNLAIINPTDARN
jgi:hypothetical protein